MQSDVTLQAYGLYTNTNPVAAPKGALRIAKNCLLDRDGMVTSRRGWILTSATITSAMWKMYQYESKLVVAKGSAALAKDNLSTHTAYSGTFTTPGGDANGRRNRVHFAEANENLYLTTYTGVRRLSGVDGTPAIAGAPVSVGLDIQNYQRSVNIAGLVRTGGNTVTVTTTADHAYYLGQKVFMNSAGEADFIAGEKTVVTIPSATTFTYTEAGANVSSGAAQTFVRSIVTGTGGFLADQKQVAYRIVFAYRDAKRNVHYGSPSSRTIVANANFTGGWVTATAKNVSARIILPAATITSDDFYFQVYRSRAVAVGSQPDDDLQLVYQDYVTSNDRSRGYAEFTDVFPDSLAKGAYIYTAPNFGRGIGTIDGENEPPPGCKDIALYKGRLWFANTWQKARFSFTVVSVGGTDGIQNGDTLLIVGVLGGSLTLTATTGTPAANQFQIFTSGAVSQNNERTALDLVRAINVAGNSFFGFYTSTPDGIPGQILVEMTDLSNGHAGDDIRVYVGKGSKRAAYNPVLPTNDGQFDLARTSPSTTVTATITSGAHTFRVGEQVTLAVGDASFPAGVKTLTAVTSTTFTYTDTPATTAALANQTFSMSKEAGTGYQEIWKNGLFYSKDGQPEAVPLKNLFRVGSGSKNITRIIPLEDALMIFKWDGLFRLTGDSPANFRLELLDPTIILFGKETPDILNNEIFCLTTLGVARVNSSGARIISGDIKDLIDTTVLSNPYEESWVDDLSFGVASNTLHRYELWSPDSGGALDQGAVSGFVWNAQSKSWSTIAVRDLDTTEKRTCGLDVRMGTAGNSIVRASLYSSTQAFIWLDLAEFEDTDYADETIDNPATATVERVGIQRVAQFAIFSKGNPAAAKQFSAAAVIFGENQSANCTVSYDNENGSAGSNTVATQASLVAQDFVRAGAQRGGRIAVTISDSTIDEPFELCGLVLVFNSENGPRASR